MAKGSGAGKAHSAKKGQESTTRNPLLDDVILLFVLAFCILLYLSYFHLAGRVGEWINGFMLGFFGMISYIVPVALFFAVAFYLSNRGKKVAWVKIGAAIALVVILCCVATLIFAEDIIKQELRTFYAACQSRYLTGGLIGCLFSWLFAEKCIGEVATWVLLIVLMIISIVLITERSFFKGVKKGSETIYNSARERHTTRKTERAEQRRIYEMEAQEGRVLRSDKKYVGVMLDTALKAENKKKDEIHEITEEYEEPETDAFDLKRGHTIEYHEPQEFVDDYIDDVVKEKPKKKSSKK